MYIYTYIYIRLVTRFMTLVKLIMFVPPPKFRFCIKTCYHFEYKITNRLNVIWVRLLQFIVSD